MVCPRILRLRSGYLAWGISLGILSILLPLQSLAIGFSDNSAIPSWAGPAIYSLGERGIITGNGDGSFAPDRPVNRAEFAKLFVGLHNLPGAALAAGQFTDVSGDEWYAPYVGAAVAKGWLNGYSDKTFRPGDPINRAEVAKIIGEALDEPFKSDIPAGAPWYDKYFYKLNDTGLMAHGTDFSNAEPAVYPTRAEVSEQLFRYMIYRQFLTTEDLQPFDGFDPYTATGGVMVVSDSLSSTDPLADASMYEYIEPFPLRYPISPNAGTMHIQDTGQLEAGYYLEPDERNIALHSLQFTCEKTAECKLYELRYRLVGIGHLSDFSSLWLEVDGRVASKEIMPISDTNTIDIQLSAPIVVSHVPRKVELRGSLIPTARKIDGRFAVFITEWVGANTRSMLGLFPLAGPDLKLLR
ncbi:S-layer homology domain-containing protein [Candidatus Peribacteria bacterium]|nr:S-layer homology domain-containing protein [Candidatus Peribacteria bacterium]